jgi:ligand-binding sensor domain-containing protein
MMRKLLLFFFLSLPGMLLAQTGHFIPSSSFSSNLINSLCQDRQGSVWVAADYGLNRFDGYCFETFLHDNADTTTVCTNVIVCVYCDGEGRLWVGTNHGLDRYDEATDAFVHYNLPGEAGSMYARVSSIIQRKDGTILVGTAGYGMYTINKEGNLQKYETEREYLNLMKEDDEGVED